MAITKRPAPRTADAFIEAAPDAKSEAPAKPQRVRKGKKLQITLTISEQTLERVDQMAERQELSRAALINMAIAQMLERGLQISGE